MKYIKTRVQTHIFPDYAQHADHYRKHMKDEIVVSAGFVCVDDDMVFRGYGKSVSMDAHSEPLNIPSDGFTCLESGTGTFGYVYLSTSEMGENVEIKRNEDGDIVCSSKNEHLALALERAFNSF